IQSLEQELGIATHQLQRLEKQLKMPEGGIGIEAIDGFFRDNFNKDVEEARKRVERLRSALDNINKAEPLRAITGDLRKMASEFNRTEEQAERLHEEIFPLTKLEKLSKRYESLKTRLEAAASGYRILIEEKRTLGEVTASEDRNLRKINESLSGLREKLDSARDGISLLKRPGEEAFTKKFEDVGKTQSEILDRQQAEALVKARKFGFEELKVVEFFAKKKREARVAAASQAAGNIASMATDMNEVLVSKGKQTNNDLFELAKA
ncbi:unnamed protein product, partial [marine sediment metagenome]